MTGLSGSSGRNESGWQGSIVDEKCFYLMWNTDNRRWFDFDVQCYDFLVSYEDDR
jgi:hypothetical protein